MALEVWSDFEAAGGTRQAVFARDDVLEASISRALDTATARFRVARDSAAYASTTEGGVLRTALIDGTYEEWVLVTRQERRGSDGIDALLEVEDPSYLLSWGTPKIERIESGRPDMDFQLNGLTATEWVNDVILTTPGWPSWIVAGTIEPTDRITIAADLVSARRLIAEIEAKANDGAGAEFVLRRNGTTDYQIDILNERGSGQAVAFISDLKNVQRLEHESTIKDAVNRVYPVGGGPRGTRLHMDQHRFSASVAGSDVTLTDPTGLAIDIVAFDDQLNGLWLKKDDDTTTDITDSTAAGDVVTVTDATGVDGTLVSIVRNSAGDGLTYLEDPTSTTDHRLIAGFLDRQDIPHANNLVTDPYVLDWTGGNPDNYAAIGSPTITQNTDTQWTMKGKSSAKVVAADGEGIELAVNLPIAPTSDDPTFVFMALFFIETLGAGASVKFQVEDVTNATFTPDTDTEASESTTTGPFQFTKRSVRLRDMQGTTSVNMRLVAKGGTATFYADAWLVSQQATVPDEFTRGRGANRLWGLANEALKDNSEPVDRFSINVLDLFRTDPDTFEFDELVPGGTLRAKDADLGLDRNFRIVQVDTNLLTAGDTTIRVAEQPRDITRIFSGRDRIAALRLDDLDPDALGDLPGQISGGQIPAGSIIASKLVEGAQTFASDLVFSATDNDTVAWTTGTITLADGTSYSINANNTGNMTAFTYIYLDVDVSTTELQTSTTASDFVGDKKLLMAVADPAPAADQDAFFVPAVGALGLNEDNISANITATNILKANTITAALINVAQLSAISADIGEVTAGQVHNSGDTVGILFSGTLPVTWDSFIDFTATGADPFLKHALLELRADGNAVTKTMLVGPHKIIDADLTANYTDDAVASLENTLYYTLELPPNVTVTDVSVRSDGPLSSGGADIAFFKVNDAGTRTTIASSTGLTHSTYTTTSLSVSEVLDSTQFYMVALENIPGGETWSIRWIKITYDMADYANTL